jgi:hypothetical protein
MIFSAPLVTIKNAGSKEAFRKSILDIRSSLPLLL